MNIRHLQYLVETVHCGGYAAASKRLYVTPRAISKAVEELEKEFGTSLFTKDRKGIKPTAFALDFAEKADKLLLDFDELQEYALLHNANQHAQNENIEIALATSYCRGSCFYINDLKKLDFCSLGIECNIFTSLSGVCLSALFEGKVDAAIVLGQHFFEGYICSTLYSFSPVVLIGKSNKLYSGESLTLGNLSTENIALPFDIVNFYPHIASILKKENSSFRFTDIGNQVSDHQSFLDSGGLILVAPNAEIISQVNNAIVRSVVPDSVISIPVCFMYSKTSKKISALNHYRNFLMRNYAEFIQ